MSTKFRSRAKFNILTLCLKPFDTIALAGGGGQNSRPYWITEVNLLELSTSPLEGEVCFQCKNLSIRKQGEGLKVEKKNTPLLWERIEHLTQSVKCVLGEGSSRREQNNYPLTLALSRRERGLLVSRNNFPLSIFNFPFIQKENRRVRFNAPQPTTKEVKNAKH